MITLSEYDCKNPITEDASPILQNGLQSFLIFHEILIVIRIGLHKKGRAIRKLTLQKVR